MIGFLVEDRLPKEGECVLAWLRKGDPHVYFEVFRDGEWVTFTIFGDK
jgi:hypothetical protein